MNSHLNQSRCRSCSGLQSDRDRLHSIKWSSKGAATARRHVLHSRLQYSTHDTERYMPK
jgi:hypothetical protein